MNGIEVKAVSKSFQHVKALNSVTLTFKENKIYGLLGRNGAGKSTLLNIITNRLFSDSGTVLVDGERASENDTAQQKIFLMSEATLYPDTMRVSDAFNWTKEFYGFFDSGYAESLCKEFGLSPKKKIKELSTGYRSIFKIVTALSVNAPYILLDEPVLGLDANHRDLFYKLLLKNYADNPRTFVISTHLIEEVSSVIEDIVIIKEGEIIKNQSCEELLKAGYTVTGAASDIDRYTAGKNVIGVDVLGGLKSAYILGEPDKSVSSGSLEFSRLDLQRLFIQLTNS